MTDDSYFDNFEIKLSITSLFSVQIMSHLGVPDIIYIDVIDSFISEILKYELSVIVSSTGPYYSYPVRYKSSFHIVRGSPVLIERRTVVSYP